MIWIARIVVALAGLFSLAMGVMAFASPTEAGQALGLGALSPLGLNALRADIGSFFLTAALACIVALFANKPSALWAAASLYGVAVIGRFIGVIVDGAPEGVAQPIIVELVMVAFLVFGAKVLKRA